MGQSIGVAVLGCGYWGSSYALAFSQLVSGRRVAVYDSRPELLAAVQRQAPGVVATRSIEEALSQPDIDAAVVCMPVARRFEVASQCIAAGKHVLVETPLATTVAEANNLIRMANGARVVMMAASPSAYSSGQRRVKELLSRNAIGSVYYLYSRRTNLSPSWSDGSVLWDLAPHDIAIFNALLDGAPDWVSAVGSRRLENGSEDVDFISLGYRDGVVAHIHIRRDAPSEAREIVVVGSERRIVFNDLAAVGEEQVRVVEKGSTPVSAEPSPTAADRFNAHDGAAGSTLENLREPLKLQSLHFLDCAATGKAPLTGGRAGCDVVAVLDAIQRSIARRGAPEDVMRQASYALRDRSVGASISATAN